MPTNVLMPQMGESIAEGTIVRWIKKVGDPIDKDEPLFEITTDKVDAEITSPGAGFLVEISVKEGETVPVNSIVAVIGETATVTGAVGATGSTGTTGTDVTSGASGPAGTTGIEGTPGAAHAVDASSSAGVTGATSMAGTAGATLETLRRTRSSPVVRRIARERGVSFTGLTGTGISGRVTKKDILAFIERGGAHAAPAGAAARASKGQTPPPAFSAGEDVRIEKMGVMRKKIAEHMVMSLQTSPHVYSAYEVDFSHIEQIRQRRKAAYEAAGAKLTYTAFIAKATIDAIGEFPFANASIDGDNILYKRAINLGIAVALDQGLIVPVIHDAAKRSMKELCVAIADLAQRARSKQLKNEDVQGGTFTITNPGIFGAAFGMPIISQPQVAILGVGTIEKRVVVVDDMIAIRPTCYLTLGFDHRLIDGADAGRFLQALKDRLQSFDESLL